MEDPIYLTEPWILTKNFQLGEAPVAPVGPPCTPAFEGTGGEGQVPSFVPEKNPFVDELTEWFHVPRTLFNVTPFVRRVRAGFRRGRGGALRPPFLHGHLSRGEEGTIEGEVTKFQFRNPHSFVYVSVKDEKGQPQEWAVEWGGAGQLRGQNVSIDTLKPGDHVVVSGDPSRTPSDLRLRMRTITRPSDGWNWSGDFN